MKRLYQILLAGLIVLPGLSIAQSENAGKAFTLEQCIEYALANSIDVKNATLDEEIANARVKETRGIGLPQIDGSVAIQHNQKLPRFFAQYNPDQAGFIDLSAIPGIKSGDVVSMQNFFQLKSAGNASVNVSQILFNGSYLVGLQAANAYRQLSEKTSVHTKENIIENVTLSYYNVLISKDRLAMFDANLSRIDSVLRSTKAMYENGFAEQIDVDRLQVQYNNTKVARDNFYNSHDLAIQLIKFQMNYPINQPIEVLGEIGSIGVDENVLMEYSLKKDYSLRSDYRVLETTRELSELDLKNKYAEGLPSLVAFANLGYSTQSPNIGGLFTTRSSIPEMEGIGPDKWYSFSSFGVSLNVPIFSGLQRTYRVQQARLSLQKNENSLTQLRSAIDLQMKNTSLVFQNALNSLKAQEQNKMLAEKVAKVTKIKFEQGVGSNLEVIEAESNLVAAQVEYYNALFTALSAKLALDRAFGKLNITAQETK